METDSTDEKIMNELLANCKTPLRNMASKLKTSFVTVMNRIKKLEEAKVIKRYTADIDYEKIGYSVHVLIDVIISKGKLFELEKRIATSPSVYAVFDTTGEYDATILARFKSTRAMDNFLKLIQTYDFVERTNTRLILNTVKQGYVPA